jgi:hypothetical protein
MPDQQQGSRVEHIKQQQQRKGQKQWQQQLQQFDVEGEGSMKGSDSCTSLSELLQQCLQHATAAAHMFQLLTLPWVQQLPAGVLKGLLVAAAERQFKALFHWLLQQPQAPRDDAEVQGYVDLLRLSTGAPAADPCCWAPQPLPSRIPLQQQHYNECGESVSAPRDDEEEWSEHESERPLGVAFAEGFSTEDMSDEDEEGDEIGPFY